MKQLIKNNRTGEIKIEEVPPPVLRKGGVLVRNEYSAISIGTETSSIEIAKKNLLEKVRSRPKELEQIRELIKKEGVVSAYKKAMSKLELPSPLGYSSAGTIVEVANDVDEFCVGDKVTCAGCGHAEIIYVSRNLCVKIPNNVKTEHAAFTTLGSIALQGVRQSDAKLDENVLVIGLGIVGQFAVQILKSAGCRVVGVDVDENKVKICGELGADLALVRNTDGIKEKILSFTDGYGIDIVIITAATSSNDPIEFASDILRDKGRITVVGAVRTDLPRKPFYEKELTLNFSRSYGPGRYDKQYEEKGIDYPIGFVRWTEKRNMKAFLNLIAEGKINIDRLITHRFKFDDAVKAYEKITNSDEMVLGAIFQYAEKVDRTSKISLTRRGEKSRKLNVLNVGFIGAGSYAQSYLFPILSKNLNVNFKGVATSTGMNAHHIGKKYGFEYVTTNADEIINDEEINCIIIATRHNLHAKYVIKGLKANKNVYVEKPLALNKKELDDILMAWKDSNADVMVGFNRRFSPHIIKLKNFIKNRKNPLAINYRINAGFIPKEHWIHDPEEGGGRIVGEVCHFVDLCNFICESKPANIFAQNLEAGRTDIPNDDSLGILIKYENGSVATISYFSNGNIFYPKERIEIFCENSIAIIDDFKKSMFMMNGKKKKFVSRKQDKGQKNTLNAYINSLKEGEKIPIPFESSLLATKI
ncbi:MAG: bi-domain-containing oxidoreductase, partial [Nanoarchaeota archaeon]|nr:bi-domain-containing oxidoreductase [Nanoarchaeota archaeon]